MKIGTRYTLFSLVAAAVPIALIVAILFGFSRRELEKMRVKDLDSIGRTLNSDLSSFKRTVSSDLALTVDDLDWTRLLLQKDASGSIDQLALIEKATRQQDLLGLTYIELLSPDSVLLARSGDLSDFGNHLDRPFLDAATAVNIEGGFAFIDATGVPALYAIASRGVFYRGNLIAYIQAGRQIDSSYLSHLNGITACSTLLFVDSGVFASTMEHPAPIQSMSGLVPISLVEGDYDVELGFLKPESNVERLLSGSLWVFGAIALLGIALSGLIGYLSSRRLTVPISELARAAEDISEGRFEQRIIWFAKDEMGTLVEGFNSMYDRLKVSQEKLIQAEKVAAWKQMARKVAHEIKNPLTPIRLSVEDLKRSYDAKSPEFEAILNEAVETIGDEITRLSRLTEEFSQFARLPAPKKEKKDVRPVIADALRIYSEKIRAERLKVKFPQKAVVVDIDSDLLTQALVNLVKNAFEAAGENGRVEVTLEEGKRIARIVVDDDGPGVPDESAEKLFTPHFTTKQDGSGLGLVIAYRIAFDHGGRIRYEPRKPRGARFIIVLPLAERPN